MLINNKNIKRPVRPTYVVGGSVSNKNMNKDLVFPMVVGVLLGALVMIFWQFTVRLNSQNARLVQLEQFATTNSQTVNDIVAFINQATAGQGGTPAGTPATPAAPVE